MIRGTLILIENANGDCLVSPQFNGGMSPYRHGLYAAGKLIVDKFPFKEVVAEFVEMYNKNYYQFSKDYIKNHDFIKKRNLVATDFHNEMGTDGYETYYKHWNSDYLYILNPLDVDIETKDFNNKELKLKANGLTTLHYGKKCKNPKLSDYGKKDEESSMSKLANKYDPPVITLKEAVKEYEIKITKKDLLTIENLYGVMSSGVEECTLWYDKDKDRIDVNGNFKSVTCTNVVVKSISNKGNICDSIANTKAHIQCSHWMFPCPDYKYSNIKRNLERAICAILDIGTCEVKSFSTNIVEFDEDEEQK